MPKYVFVTGGVTSSLGQGITAARIGRTLDHVLHDFEMNEAHWLKAAHRGHHARPRGERQ